jgi:hypothetical protein
MKILINAIEIFTLSEIQKKVIQNDIPASIFKEDMQRRMHHWIHHPVNRCIEQKAKEWRDLLSTHGINTVNSDSLLFANKVMDVLDINLLPENNTDTIISIDNEEAFRYNPINKRVLRYLGILQIEEWIKERVRWILIHKYERCMERLRREWEPKLGSAGVQFIPLIDEDFAFLVFSRPEYKDRESRENLIKVTQQI